MTVEEQLKQDMRICGICFYVIEDGVKTRLNPLEVTVWTDKKTKQVTYKYADRVMTLPVIQEQDTKAYPLG